MSDSLPNNVLPQLLGVAWHADAAGLSTPESPEFRIEFFSNIPSGLRMGEKMARSAESEMIRNDQKFMFTNFDHISTHIVRNSMGPFSLVPAPPGLEKFGPQEVGLVRREANTFSQFRRHPNWFRRSVL